MNSQNSRKTNLPASSRRNKFRSATSTGKGYATGCGGCPRVAFHRNRRMCHAACLVSPLSRFAGSSSIAARNFFWRTPVGWLTITPPESRRSVTTLPWIWCLRASRNVLLANTRSRWCRPCFTEAMHGHGRTLRMNRLTKRLPWQTGSRELDPVMSWRIPVCRSLSEKRNDLRRRLRQIKARILG